ncbi:hypothetical protein N303_14865, partial [Cuculus canorus]
IGLCVAPEKIPLWKYMGLKIQEQTIQPQQVKPLCSLKTLSDVQKLLGAIKWVHPLLGITMEEIHPLFMLLKGDSDLTSPRQLNKDSLVALDKVAKNLSRTQTFCKCLNTPIELYIISAKFQLFGVLAQWVEGVSDKFRPLEWVFLPHQFSKTITTQHEMLAMLIQKGCHSLLELNRMDPFTIYVPVTQEQVVWLLKHSLSIQIVLADYKGQISICYPPSPLLNLFECISLIPTMKLSHIPFKEALTVFTDGSGKTGKSVIVWRTKTVTWKLDICKVSRSPQIVELAAVVRCFKLFSQPINIVSNSANV